MTDISSLTIALNETDGTQRRQAALSLGAAKEPGAAAALLDRLAVEQDARVLEDLTWALVQHVTEVEDALLGMLGEPTARSRRIAAHVLSKVGDPDHYAAIAPLIADSDPDVAIKAYRAAANTGGSRAAAELVSQLAVGDQLQRDALTNALANIGEAVVVPLSAALQNPNEQVREHAAEALGHLGEPEADQAADALAALAGDPSAQVRIAAVSALGQLGESADAELLRLTEHTDRAVALVAKRFLDDRRAAS